VGYKEGKNDGEHHPKLHMNGESYTETHASVLHPTIMTLLYSSVKDPVAESVKA
jgi:hypothetical protein